MHRQPSIRSLVAILLFAGFVSAQDRTHDITVEDYFSIATVTELAVSPDGKQVAYCESRWLKSADNRKGDLWVVSTDGKGKPRRLTSSRANDRHPQWAADGKSIYVLGNRKRAGETNPPHDGTTQVWQVYLDGRSPRAVTQVEKGVVAFDYAPQADAVFYSVDATDPDKDAFAQLRSTYDKLDYGHGKRKVSEVYRLDLDTWRAEKVIAERRYIREMTVTPDGKRVAMITAPDDTVITSEGRSRVDVWDAATKKVTPTDQSWRKSAASPYPWLGSLAWSNDGNRLAYCTIFDAYPAEVIINEWKDNRWVAERMKRPAGVQILGYGSPLRFNEFGGLIYLAESAGLVVPRGYNLDKRESEAPADAWAGKVTQMTHRAGKQTVGLVASGEHFPELFAASPGNDTLVRLTNLNPQTRNWKLPTVRHVTWKAPDGTEVGGVLELPHGYGKGKKLPLVVAIHGGPTTSSKAELVYDAHNGRLYFAAHGYAVLCPNYRGSTGYGDRFVTDLIGHENDVEVKDILAGIQHLIKQGIADPERIAVMGWSNGGYLTNCLITLKDSPVKIRAASSGAGILDTVAEWGFNDEPAYPMVFKKGLPWETPEIYRKTSPTYGLGNVTTPTLIHVGGNDERCPPGHSRMLYRALREYVKVPTELLVYPGEPHGLGKYTNRKAKMEWDLAWFDRYVLSKKTARRPKENLP